MKKMGNTILTIVAIRLMVALWPFVVKKLRQIWQRLQINMRNTDSTALFDDYFIESKTFYVREFGKIPSIAFIGNIDTTKVIDLINENRYGKIKAIYRRNYYSWEKDQIEASKILVKLSGNLMIKLGNDWAEILYSSTEVDKAHKMLLEFKGQKAMAKEQDFEINVISLSGRSLELKTLSIKPTVLDIGLFYNDDFRKVDAVIRERLSKENDKGIVLLHGLPGTGKTTYLRHLIGTINKQVLFVSPAVAANLMNPEFMDLLLDNPNSVLVIEDAENIIMERRYSSHSSVSNLLNISDGLLSDCLNVQIICTFNSAIEMVDTALLRKGRLIARYEFGKLEPQKATALSKHLGVEKEYHLPASLAEITNPGSVVHETIRKQTIGFRRELVLEN